jgi:hypothetical protein
MKMTLVFILLSLSSIAFSGVVLPVFISHPENRPLNINEIKKNKVLVFISRTCPCTQKNIPYINELVKEFPQMEFIGIHSVKQINPKLIDEIIAEYKPQFTIVNDEDLAIANILKANRTPQVVVLSEKNEILYDGGVTNRTNPKNADKFYLHNALVEIAQNKPITEKETRSLGCVIVR